MASLFGFLGPCVSLAGLGVSLAAACGCTCDGLGCGPPLEIVIDGQDGVASATYEVFVELDGTLHVCTDGWTDGPLQSGPVQRCETLDGGEAPMDVERAPIDGRQRLVITVRVKANEVGVVVKEEGSEVATIHTAVSYEESDLEGACVSCSFATVEVSLDG